MTTKIELLTKVIENKTNINATLVVLNMGLDAFTGNLKNMAESFKQVLEAQIKLNDKTIEYLTNENCK